MFKLKNKVLVRVSVPEIDESVDVFIPVNELIWKIKKMLLKSICDVTGAALDYKGDYVLLNMITSVIYTNNKVVIDTDIRNGTELLLIKK